MWWGKLDTDFGFYLIQNREVGEKSADDFYCFLAVTLYVLINILWLYNKIFTNLKENNHQIYENAQIGFKSTYNNIIHGIGSIHSLRATTRF